MAPRASATRTMALSRRAAARRTTCAGCCCSSHRCGALSSCRAWRRRASLCGTTAHGLSRREGQQGRRGGDSYSPTTMLRARASGTSSWKTLMQMHTPAVVRASSSCRQAYPPRAQSRLTLRNEMHGYDLCSMISVNVWFSVCKCSTFHTVAKTKSEEGRGRKVRARRVSVKIVSLLTTAQAMHCDKLT